MDKPHKILVIDDKPENLELLKRILAIRGYRTQMVTSGALGLSAVKLEPPELILLDIMMPGMDGHTVCAELKKDPDTRDIPIIFMSGIDATQEKVKAFRSGGVDYVIKPFQTEEVLARVGAHLKISQLQRELKAQLANQQQANDPGSAGPFPHQELKVLLKTVILSTKMLVEDSTLKPGEAKLAMKAQEASEKMMRLLNKIAH
jgi:DNA-binding response OmpR family regulator